MNEIKLPVKYALFPIDNVGIEGKKDIVAYIIAKCYFIEGKISYDLDGTISSTCKVIACKDAKNAFVDGKINEEYIVNVSCVFNDLDLAEVERDRINDQIIEKLKESFTIDVINNWKNKLDKTIRSMEKLRMITEKQYAITSNDKRLIYSKEQ